MDRPDYPSAFFLSAVRLLFLGGGCDEREGGLRGAELLVGREILFVMDDSLVSSYLILNGKFYISTVLSYPHEDLPISDVHWHTAVEFLQTMVIRACCFFRRSTMDFLPPVRVPYLSCLFILKVWLVLLFISTVTRCLLSSLCLSLLGVARCCQSTPWFFGDCQVYSFGVVSV